MFPRLKPTKNAQAQMLKTIEGATLRFSRVGLGNGERPSVNFEDVTQMQNFVCFGNLTSYERDGTNAIIHWQLDCASVENTFDWTEYALFALDENDNEFLFSYAYNEGTPQPISSVISESLVMLENDINICIGDAEHVSAIIGEYSAYANKEVVESHLKDTRNPHKVSAEDIGLENVDNVSTNNAVPTFTEATTLENINSGEKVTTLWGKVKKAISTLSAHISNKNNPHGETAEQIGAAKASHTHSTTDINDGYLPITRGGTGGSSAFAALENLITKAAQHIYLAKSRYIYGKDANGNNVACCGVWPNDGSFFGNDSMMAHLHGTSICIRVIDLASGAYKYLHLNKQGTLYPGENKTQNLGASSYRFSTIYAGAALNTSDRKEKENITDCKIGLKILKRLSFKDFNFIGKDEKSVGLIAQEVFDLFQELDIHNSDVYSAAVKNNDASKHPELENLTDEQIHSYTDEQLSWSLNYQSIMNYCIAGFQQYMQISEQRLNNLESLIGGNDVNGN